MNYRRVEPEQQEAPCQHCGLLPLFFKQVYRVDGCFGDILGAVNSACCGHGDPTKAYVHIDRVHSDGTDGCVAICGGTRRS